jgi:hypothetical protein
MSENITISLAGSPVDVDNFDFQVSISHGRADVMASPTASTCQIVLRGAAGPQLELTDEIIITSHNLPRFTGKISDLDVSFISTEPPQAITTITGMGYLADLGYVEVGASGWSEETVRQRAEEILTASGLAYLNGGDPDITLHSVSPGNAEPSTALDGLANLAQWSGATYYDDPQGRIVFEDYGDRGITAFAGIWSNQPDTWADTGGTWESFPLTIAGFTLDVDGVVFSPVWSKSLGSVINDITVVYYSGNEVNQTDSASITAYGRREYRLETQIKSSTDATTRASGIITAQANPLWNLGQVSILVHELSETDLYKVLKLVSGALVIATGMPETGPYAEFNGIVEGWTDSYSNGQHVLTLSLSDPRFSFEMLEFGEVTGTVTWGDVGADAQWFEIITNDDLIGV